MAQYAKPTDQQKKPEDVVRRERQPVPDFKPVALPALRAAMQAVGKQPQRTGPRDLPAILRKESD